MSTTSKASMTTIDTISPAFTQLTFQTQYLEDLKSLLPVNVFADNSYELAEIKLNEAPQSFYESNNTENIQSDIFGIEKAKALFNTFSGFPQAQQLIRYVQATEDLRLNPTLSLDDTIWINDFNYKTKLKTELLSNTIFTLKYWDDANGQTVIITDFDTVTDLEELTAEDKTKIELLINKYKDTTNWQTYNIVNYMPLVEGGLQNNQYRGTGITSIEYISAAPSDFITSNSFDMFTQLTTPTPMSDVFSGATPVVAAPVVAAPA